MRRHPTPITDALKTLGADLAARAKNSDLPGPVELQRTAAHLRALARRTAPLERFHAELVAEAAEEELRQADAATGLAGEKIIPR